MNKPENTLVDVAGRIAVHANAENKKFGIDPLTILTIISTIIRIIAMIYECRKSRDYAKRTIKKPGIFARFLMKHAIRKHFPKGGREALYNAMLAVGPQLSEKELDETLDIVETELKSK